LEGTLHATNASFELLEVSALDRPGLTPSGATPIIWSGGLGESLFAASPETWLTAGWEQLSAAVPTLPDGTLIRPHAAHVISDAPSCRRLVDLAAPHGVGLALAPASMLTEAMWTCLEDHLERFFSLTSGLAQALVLEDLPAPGDHPVALGGGAMPGPLIGELARAYLADDCPVLARAASPEEAAQWLGW